MAEKYTPFGHKDYKTVVQDIKDPKPDVSSARSTATATSTSTTRWPPRASPPTRCRSCAVSVGEDELRGLDPSPRSRATWPPGTTSRASTRPKNKEFVKKFKDKYGKDNASRTTRSRPPTPRSTSGSKAVEKAKSTDVDKVREAMRAASSSTPRAARSRSIDKNQHTYKPFYMGKIRDDKQFDIVYKTGLDRARTVSADRLPRLALRLDQGRRSSSGNSSRRLGKVGGK